MRSVARCEGLDAVSVAHELRHDGNAAEDEERVENSLPDAAEVKQGGERPRAGKGCAEHLGADQDGGADHGDDIEPDNATVFGHEGLLCEAQSPRIRLPDQVHSGGSGVAPEPFDLARGRAAVKRQRLTDGNFCRARGRPTFPRRHRGAKSTCTVAAVQLTLAQSLRPTSLLATRGIKPAARCEARPAYGTCGFIC